MSWRRDQFLEDRALRDAARAVMAANLAHLRGLLSLGTSRERLTQRVTEEARNLADEAGRVASENKGAIAFLLAAFCLWFGRNEILSLINRSGKSDKEEGKSEAAAEDTGLKAPQHEFEEAT